MVASAVGIFRAEVSEIGTNNIRTVESRRMRPLMQWGPGQWADVEATLASEMTERAESHGGTAYCVFTATAKNKTLELFRRKGRDGKPVEFRSLSDAAGDRGVVHPRCPQGLSAYDAALKIAAKVETGDGEVKEAAACKGVMWLV